MHDQKIQPRSGINGPTAKPVQKTLISSVSREAKKTGKAVAVAPTEAAVVDMVNTHGHECTFHTTTTPL
jgi:CMP-2-keto-3-deoxyoctulosonic acid synthetase